MLFMSWDKKLECVAQKYIENIAGGFSHNSARTSDYADCGGEGYVGENWYSGGPDSATEAWVDYEWGGCSERDAYYGRCNGVTGHFTQVAWANSEYIGCGYTQSGGTVCNYSPGGNYNGQDPWMTGSACSDCDEEIYPYCVNGLCSRTKNSAVGVLFVVSLLLVVLL
eukprot:TRINITY_DN481_c0_g1_i1.p1 TRINITY_DN481_c0_g1~~TRINITY_DN481_c0_g1_i1.p1  ORF type:complete len:167 (+),score=35.45 TRINITY_DN481_c0_g1_i1:686-1186(+)